MPAFSSRTGSPSRRNCNPLTVLALARLSYVTRHSANGFSPRGLKTYSADVVALSRFPSSPNFLRY